MHLSLSHYLFSPLDETSMLNYLNCARKISVSARRSYLPEISWSWVESIGQRGSLSSGSSIITVAPVWLHTFHYPAHDPVNPVWVCVSLTVRNFHLSQKQRDRLHILAKCHYKSDICNGLYMVTCLFLKLRVSLVSSSTAKYAAQTSLMDPSGRVPVDVTTQLLMCCIFAWLKLETSNNDWSGFTCFCPWLSPLCAFSINHHVSSPTKNTKTFEQTVDETLS